MNIFSMVCIKYFIIFNAFALYDLGIAIPQCVESHRGRPSCQRKRNAYPKISKNVQEC